MKRNKGLEYQIATIGALLNLDYRGKEYSGKISLKKIKENEVISKMIKKISPYLSEIQIQTSKKIGKEEQLIERIRIFPKKNCELYIFDKEIVIKYKSGEQIHYQGNLKEYIINVLPVEEPFPFIELTNQNREYINRIIFYF